MSEKTIVYTPEGGSGSAGLGMLGLMAPFMQRNGIDPSTLVAAMNNRGGSLFGGNGLEGLIALLVVCGLFGNGGFGFGGGFGGGNGAGAAALGNLINNNDGREALAQAIAGNHEAIRDLAANLNVSVSSIQSAINAANLAIQQVGNQVGMSGMQIVNAIQSGNADIASKLASGFCDIRNGITQQGYENRLATLQQTDAILAKIGEQTTILNEKFCDLEKREMQDKIAALSQQNTILRGTIDNANQTAAIQGFVGQQLAPITAQLVALGKEVDDVKCKMPQTVSVPYQPYTAVPTYAAYGMYAGGYGYGYGGNGFYQ